MKNKIIAIIIFITLAHLAQAQYLRGGYFVENSSFSHKLNPAFAPNRGYISIPVIGSVGIWNSTNMGIENFLFPLESGKMGTFLHPDVSSDTFLSTLNDNNTLYSGAYTDIISGGWYDRRGSFWNISLGMTASGYLNAPKTFFSFVKNGMTSSATTYIFEDMNLDFDLDYNLSVGYSSNLNKQLRVGAKVRVILPFTGADMTIHKMQLDLDSEQWRVTSDITSHLYGNNLAYLNNGDNEIRGIDIVKGNYLSFAGVGASIDMGINYEFSSDTPLKGLSLSASILDLGVISYSKSTTSLARSNGTTSFKGFDDLFKDDFDLKSEIDTFLDYSLELLSLIEQNISDAKNRMTPLSINLAAHYNLLDGLMGIGVLYTERPIIGTLGREITISYLINPIKDKLSLTLGYSFANIRSSFGWSLHYTSDKFINCFIGSDYTHLKLSKQYIPIDKLFANIQFGFSIPLGRGSN